MRDTSILEAASHARIDLSPLLVTPVQMALFIVIVLLYSKLFCENLGRAL